MLGFAGGIGDDIYSAVNFERAADSQSKNFAELAAAGKFDPNNYKSSSVLNSAQTAQAAQAAQAAAVAASQAAALAKQSASDKKRKNLNKKTGGGLSVDQRKASAAKKYGGLKTKGR